MEIYNGPEEIVAGVLAERLVSGLPDSSDLKSAPGLEAVRVLVVRGLRTLAKPPEQQDVTGPLNRIADELAGLNRKLQVVLDGPPLFGKDAAGSE